MPKAPATTSSSKTSASSASKSAALKNSPSTSSKAAPKTSKAAPTKSATASASASESKTTGTSAAKSRKSAPQKSVASEDATPAAMSPEQRDEMVRYAAYHLAEKDGFQPGREQDYWFQAQEQVDQLVNGIQSPAPEDQH